LKINKPSFQIFARKTNRMHLYPIKLFQLYYPPHVSNKDVHHQEVISVHAAYSIHYTVCCMLYVQKYPPDDELVCSKHAEDKLIGII
jgi:hypothetical protein